jgi:hypothetical protein
VRGKLRAPSIAKSLETPSLRVAGQLGIALLLPLSRADVAQDVRASIPPESSRSLRTGPRFLVRGCTALVVRQVLPGNDTT